MSVSAALCNACLPVLFTREGGCKSWSQIFPEGGYKWGIYKSGVGGPPEEELISAGGLSLVGVYKWVEFIFF